MNEIVAISNATINGFYTISVWKHGKKNIILKMLHNYQGGEITGAQEQLEKFETFYIEKGDYYEERHRVKNFEDVKVEEILLNYFTLLSDESDWIEDDKKLKAWCDKYDVDNYSDWNAFESALLQNGWMSIDHYHVIAGDIKSASNRAPRF